MIRLDKFLADMQIGTRSQVKDYIKKGLSWHFSKLSKKQRR